MFKCQTLTFHFSAYCSNSKFIYPIRGRSDRMRIECCDCCIGRRNNAGRGVIPRQSSPTFFWPWINFLC